jgi:hypothetical protein
LSLRQYRRWCAEQAESCGQNSSPAVLGFVIFQFPIHNKSSPAAANWLHIYALP